MTEENLGVQARALRRIAAASANRAPVDANGRHTTAPSTFSYDENGKLVTATSDPTPVESKHTDKSNVVAFIPDRKLPDDGPGSASHGYLRPVS